VAESEGLSQLGIASKEAVGSGEELAVWKIERLGGEVADRGDTGRPATDGRTGL
jgi:hypothetical protein